MDITLILFALFFIKHFLADFVFQTDTMITTKGTYGATGGIHHAYVHAILTAVVLLPVLTSLILVMLMAVLDGVIHYHIDWVKMNIGKKYNHTPADTSFWFWIGLDQMAHNLTYIGIIALVV